MMNNGAGRWLIQRVSGIALLIMLLAHFWATHAAGGEITYEAVMQRLSQPYWKIYNLAFLVLAIYHGLNGGWTVLEDYLQKGWMRVTLFGVVVVVGLYLLVQGSLTIMAFQTKS
jgi:succinate dehydrogenase / fumarate reductase membrane anchor subunit